MFLQSAGLEAQELGIAIQRTANQTFGLSVVNPVPSTGHTFFEFLTNGVWHPAYFTSSNSVSPPIHTVTNAGGMRLFRALRGPTIAQADKASWQRLGVTNYVFDFFKACVCGSTVSATVTVMNDEVVLIENAQNLFGEPIADPPLSDGTTINRILDAWILSEPEGGYARELRFDLNGFPQSIDIDLDPRAADEELTYQIHNFTPLP